MRAEPVCIGRCVYIVVLIHSKQVQYKMTAIIYTLESNLCAISQNGMK